MTMTPTKEFPRIAEILRGDPASRPPSDRHTAAGLRANLEDALYLVSHGRRRSSPLLISPQDLRATFTGVVRQQAPLGRLRGILVAEILRLIAVGFVITDPYLDAVAAWMSTRPHPESKLAFDQLEPDERARLATDVTAHSVVLLQHFGHLQSTWNPRSSVSIIQHLGGGDVIVRDRIDLVVGSSSSLHSSVALFDVITGPLDNSSELVLNYHALLETLRTGVVPLRVVALSTATGEVLRHDVTTSLLQQAATLVSESIARKWSKP